MNTKDRLLMQQAINKNHISYATYSDYSTMFKRIQQVLELIVQGVR